LIIFLLLAAAPGLGVLILLAAGKRVETAQGRSPLIVFFFVVWRGIPPTPTEWIL